MIFFTRFALSNAASPISPLPALLLTIVRSFAPRAISASMSSEGMPAVPKPPIITVAPSLTSASAAAVEFLILSIILSASLCLWHSATSIGDKKPAEQRQRRVGALRVRAELGSIRSTHAPSRISQAVLRRSTTMMSAAPGLVATNCGAAERPRDSLAAVQRCNALVQCRWFDQPSWRNRADSHVGGSLLTEGNDATPLQHQGRSVFVSRIVSRAANRVCI